MARADCASAAQPSGVAGARKLLRPPGEPARLPFLAAQACQAELWKALTEGVASIADFLGYVWRRKGLPPDNLFVAVHPCWCMGSMRSALFQEQVGAEGRQRHNCLVVVVGVHL